MRIPLLEGYIVRPSNARGVRPIRLVEGINVNQSETFEPPLIDVETIPAFVPASSPYPFRIDVSEHLRLHGAEPPFSINMVRVQEFTESVEQRLLDEDDPYISMDESGIITYRPRGTYLNNALVIGLQVGDVQRPPTAPAKDIGEVYRREKPPPDPNRLDRRPIGGGVQENGELAIHVLNNILGMPEAWAEFWQNQGMNGTCALVCVTAMMQSLGVTDENGDPLTLEKVINDGLYRMKTADGKHPLYTAHETVTVFFEPGKPRPPDPSGFSVMPPSRYYVIVRNGTPDETAYLLSDAKSGRITLTQEAIEYLERLNAYRHSPDYAPRFEDMPRKIYPTGAAVPELGIPVDLNVRRDGWNIINRMMEFYGVESHTGRATDFRAVLRLLEEDRRIAIYVDADELHNNRYIRRAQENGEQWLLNYLEDPLESTASHAIWVTGIDLSDPENPMVIVNDSGASASDDTGRAERLSLPVFLSVWKDSGYTFTATGEPIPEIESQAIKHRTVRENVDRTIASMLYSRADANIPPPMLVERLKSAENLYDFSRNINDEELLDEVEFRFPGTKATWEEYLAEKESEDNDIYERYNLDPEEIKRLQDEADE